MTKSSQYTRARQQVPVVRKPDHPNEDITMRKLTSVILTVLALVSVTGCQQTPVAESNRTLFDEVDANQNQSGLVTYLARTGEKPANDPVDERSIRLYEKAVEPLRYLTKNYAEGSISLEEFDAGARGILEGIAGDEGIISEAEQSVAHAVLHAILTDQSAPQETIAYYTDILVQRKSPHAEVIYEALVALDGYWNEEHVKTAASESIMNAEAWLGDSEDRVRISADSRSDIGSALQDMSQLAE